MKYRKENISAVEAVRSYFDGARISREIVGIPAYFRASEEGVLCHWDDTPISLSLDKLVCGWTAEYENVPDCACCAHKTWWNNNRVCRLKAPGPSYAPCKDCRADENACGATAKWFQESEAQKKAEVSAHAPDKTGWKKHKNDLKTFLTSGPTELGALVCRVLIDVIDELQNTEECP